MQISQRKRPALPVVLTDSVDWMLCRGGVVGRWLRKTRLICLVQYRLGLIGAAAAAFGDAQVRSELIEIVHAGGRSAADLLIGYSFADADVHKFNNLAGFDYLNANENDCQ